MPEAESRRPAAGRIVLPAASGLGRIGLRPPASGRWPGLMVRVSAGPLDAIPTDHCFAIADDRAVVARVGEQVVAFENRCLHQDSRLAGGRVENGKLTCPMHFWRYDASSGRHLGGRGSLPTYPVEIVDGEVFVEVPEPEPELSMREMMLRHAREWTRE